MIPRERERDLHALLDGSATPAERARTEAWLETSADARQRRNELEALFAALASVRQEPAPEGLRDDVLAATRARGAAGPARRPAGMRPRWALVAPLAAVLLAAVAFPWWRHALSPQALPEVAGSISGTAVVPGTAHWRVGAAGVSVRVASGAEGLTATFVVRSELPVVLELAPAAGASLDVHEGQAWLAIAGDGATVRALDRARFVVTFPAAASRPIRLTILADGRRAAVTLPSPALVPGDPGEQVP